MRDLLRHVADVNARVGSDQTVLFMVFKVAKNVGEVEAANYPLQRREGRMKRLWMKMARLSPSSPRRRRPSRRRCRLCTSATGSGSCRQSVASKGWLVIFVYPPTTQARTSLVDALFETHSILELDLLMQSL